MRTYGRLVNPDGSFKLRPDGGFMWATVVPDDTGDESDIWLTTFCQSLLMQLGESQMYSTIGVDYFGSVTNQVSPTLNVENIRSKYAQFFRSLVVTEYPTQPQGAHGIPTKPYAITAVYKDGTNNSILAG